MSLLPVLVVQSGSCVAVNGVTEKKDLHLCSDDERMSYTFG